MSVQTFADPIPSLPERREPEYRYALYDLLSRTLLAEHMPFAISEYSRSLVEPGTITATLPLGDPLIRKLQPRERTQPRRTTLVILRDETVVGEYLIWQRPPYKPTSRTLTVNASEIPSYFSHRLLRPTEGVGGSQKTLAFTGVDQYAIFRALLADLQSVTYQGQPVGDLSIEMDAAQMSGVLRDRRDQAEERGAYHGYEFRPYSELLDNLSNVDNGFEWRIDTYLDADRALRRVLRLGHPYLGHPPDDDAITLEYPGNVTDFDWPEDGSNSANAVFCVGAGEEATMKWAEAYSPELATGYPILERATSYKSVSVQATLNAHAVADVAALAGDITVPTFEVMGRPDLSPGDHVKVRISDDALFEGSERLPREIWMRAVQITTHPGPPERTVIAAEVPRTPGEGT